MSKIKLLMIVFLFAGCSVPDFMVQGQLDDFERALEAEDVNWIMDQYTDDVVRELPDGFKFKGKDEVRMYWEDLFQSVDNIDVEAIDFVTSGFPPAKLALHWRWKADVVAKSKYFKFDTVGTTIKIEGMDLIYGSGFKTARVISFWNTLDMLQQAGYKVTK